MEYKYPRDMVAPLRAAWDGRLPREWDTRPLPDDELLLRLLEVSYHASFTADEQRGTRFRLVVTEPTGEVGMHDPLLILPKREFTPHEIMRLAPAGDPDRLIVGLDPTDLSIWGLCSYPSQRLEVTAHGPGFLRVGRNYRGIVTLERGQITSEDSAIGIDYGMLLSTFAEAQEALWADIDYQPGSWNAQLSVYPRQMLGLAVEISRHGHGGCLFVVPESEAREGAWRRMLRIKYECDDGATWPLLRQWMLRFDTKTLTDKGLDTAIPTRTSIDAHLGRIPRLALVDGAVVITDRFRLLGFGAEVVVSAAIDDVIMPHGKTRSIEDFGTRHRSAFRLCSAYPKAVAFVCSQDGGVKCIRNVDDRVRVWGG